MSVAEDIYLGQLVWADLTATQKRDAVHGQLAEGRSIEEAVQALSAIYGPIGKNHVIGVIDRHDLRDDEEVRAAQRFRRAEELRTKAARARALKPVLLPKEDRLPKIPVAPIGTGRTGRKVSFFDLKDRHCKRPLWDSDAVGLEEKFYCGAPAMEGKSYCKACNAELTTEPLPLRDRRDSLRRGAGRYLRWK